MGSQRTYLGGGNFSEYLYAPVEGTTEIINGLRCKVVRLVTDTHGNHSSMPQYSKTSDIYLVLGADGKPKQMGIFKDHHLVMDMDWSHPHKNPGNGERFPKGVVHVHPDVSHNADARYMNNGEIKLYGDVIHHYAPNAKLRP